MKNLIVIFTLGLCFCANAASEMKPGLWEDHFTIKSKSGKIEKKLAELKKTLANMPVDQRKMMEAAMASQGAGLTLNNDSVKICISIDQAQRLEVPRPQTSKCKHEEVSRTSEMVKIKFHCDGADVTSGEGEFKLTGPTSYVASAVVNTVDNGVADQLTLNQKGKWISSDCGNIKSVPLKK